MSNNKYAHIYGLANAYAAGIMHLDLKPIRLGFNLDALQGNLIDCELAAAIADEH